MRNTQMSWLNRLWLLLSVALPVVTEYQYHDHIERSLSVSASFVRYMGSEPLSDADVTRYNLLLPYFLLSSKTDEVLSELAEEVLREYTVNAGHFYPTILTNLDHYCRASVKREILWDGLRSSLASTSEPVKRGLMGMIDEGRKLDAQLLQHVFRPTSSVAVHNRLPNQNLLLKCSLTAEDYPFIFTRLDQLRLSIFNDRFRDGDRVVMRSNETSWFVWAQGDIHLSQSTPTHLVVNQSNADFGWTITVPESTQGRDYLQISNDTLVVAQRPTLTPLFRFFPTVEQVYYVDTTDLPCHFLSLDNKTDPWQASIRLKKDYPPSKLAIWDIDNSVQKVHA